MKTCLICGDPVPAFPHNRSLCTNPDCAKARMLQRSRFYYQRDRYNNRHKAHRNKFYCYVLQPGQAIADGWHKADYDRYKHDLPEGTKVVFP